MNFFSALALLSGLSLLLGVGCNQSNQNLKSSKLTRWMSQNEKLKVLCTTSMIADLVEAIGDDSIDCLTLIQGESDPHSYQLVKGDDEKFERADLIFFNGLGLEHGPSLAERLKDNPKAHAVGEYVRNKRPKDMVMIDSGLDPHIWMDVSLWNETVPYISETLMKAAPVHKNSYAQRASALSSRLLEIHQEIKNRLETVPEASRYLVTSHIAFNYFVRAYLSLASELSNNQWSVRAMAPEGLAPDSQLSTADIQRIVDHIIKYRVITLFPESNVSHDSLKKLADACKKLRHQVILSKQPLYADAMGPRGSKADSYIGMMRYDSQVVENGLQTSTGVAK